MVHSDKIAPAPNTTMAHEIHAVTDRCFQIGDEILVEEALVIGPIAEPCSPICVGCGVVVNTSSKCFDCGWPICCFECDKLEHHASNECEIFKKCSKMSFQQLTSKRSKVYHQYACILPIRILFLSERSPDKWQFIESLNSNVDIRRDTPVWQKESTYIVKYIREKCKLKKFEDELIHKICGIIDANCFHVNTKNHIRCIYKNSLNFSHSCIPNTSCIILPSHNFKIFVRASNDIRKGERLTYCMVKPTLPTLLRRQELLHSSFVSCCCDRCSDATELQSNFSTLKCSKCKTGPLLPVDPLDFESDWKCNKCDFKKKYSQIKKLYNDVEKELNQIHEEESNFDESASPCEKLLEKYESVFHYNHAFMVFLKLHSLRTLNEETFSLFDLETINKKIIRLHEILNVFEVIAPGYTILRGTTLNWLHKAYIAKAKCFNLNVPTDRDLYMKCMSKALQFLKLTQEIMIILKPFTETGGKKIVNPMTQRAEMGYGSHEGRIIGWGDEVKTKGSECCEGCTKGREANSVC